LKILLEGGGNKMKKKLTSKLVGRAREKHEKTLIDKIHILCESDYSDYGKLLRIRSLLEKTKEEVRKT
jgi:hypothetical protein